MFSISTVKTDKTISNEYRHILSLDNNLRIDSDTSKLTQAEQIITYRSTKLFLSSM
jgi:hypothetical protein